MAKRKEAALEEYIKKVKRAGGTTGVNLNKVEQVANGQYVLMKVEDTDNVWTLLGEFSDIKVRVLQMYATEACFVFHFAFAELSGYYCNTLLHL